MSGIDAGVRVTPLDESHARAVASLHAECFPTGWSPEDIRQYAREAVCYGLTIWKNAQLAGFVIASSAGGEAEILTLATARDFRRLGLARTLLDALCSDLSRRGVQFLFLEAGVRNDAAVSLYRGYGFKTAGRRPAYYPGTTEREDALIMRLPLQERETR